MLRFLGWCCLHSASPPRQASPATPPHRGIIVPYGHCATTQSSKLKAQSSKLFFVFYAKVSKVYNSASSKSIIVVTDERRDGSFLWTAFNASRKRDINQHRKGVLLYTGQERVR